MPISNPDLSRIRQLLALRREVLAERHGRIECDLVRRNDPLVADSSDQAIQLANDETLQAIDETTRLEIVATDEALQRLDNGLYGTCKRCYGEIEAARMRVLPQAVMCADCASL